MQNGTSEEQNDQRNHVVLKIYLYRIMGSSCRTAILLPDKNLQTRYSISCLKNISLCKQQHVQVAIIWNWPVQFPRSMIIQREHIWKFEIVGSFQKAQRRRTQKCSPKHYQCTIDDLQMIPQWLQKAIKSLTNQRHKIKIIASTWEEFLWLY